MDVCAILLGIGLTVLCPAKPDPVVEEMRAQQEEQRRQERETDAKIERLYRGLGECPECGKGGRLDPKTLTRDRAS